MNTSLALLDLTHENVKTFSISSKVGLRGEGYFEIIEYCFGGCCFCYIIIFVRAYGLSNKTSSKKTILTFPICIVK